MQNLTHGVQMIANERQKQIYKHGFTAEHHANHPEWYGQNQLQQAALLLLMKEVEGLSLLTCPKNWDADWFQNLLDRSTYDRVRIAGALLAAELDRMEALKGPSAIEVLKSVNEKLSNLLCMNTDEKLLESSQSLLPEIQSECAAYLVKSPMYIRSEFISNDIEISNPEIAKLREKAEKWDKLDAEIGKYYESTEEEDISDGLIGIGEVAAYAFGYL